MGCTGRAHSVRVILLLGAALTAAGTAMADEPPPAPPLGVGFLWYPRSEEAAGRLTSESDFVDLILSGGKLDVFDKVRPPVRVVCLALSLERNDARPFPGVKETIEILRAARVDPARVIIGYNPERAPGTTAQELDDLLESVQRARDMAHAYGSPLLVGPGLREMQQREELYPDLARHCEIWLIQSQRLQMEPATRQVATPAEYRAGIERIVDLLRRGNPEIRVFVQVLASGRRDETLFTAEQVVAYARAIEDLVQAVRIYGGSPQLLEDVINQLRPPPSTTEAADR